MPSTPDQRPTVTSKPTVTVVGEPGNLEPCSQRLTEDSSAERRAERTRREPSYLKDYVKK